MGVRGTLVWEVHVITALSDSANTECLPFFFSALSYCGGYLL